MNVFGVSTELPGQFLVTVGDNAERIRNEAALAKLCGVSPKPASSGRKRTSSSQLRRRSRRQQRPRYIVAIVRLQRQKATQEYVTRRIGQDSTNATSSDA